jgi:hypothetical protein
MDMNSGGLFQNLGVIELPFNLDIAKKSLTSTISALYAMMIVGMQIPLLKFFLE